MKTLVPNYYILDKPKESTWAKYTKDTRLFLNWSFSLLFRRAFVSIAVGPNELMFQKSIHPMFLTDDRTEKGLVVINVLPEKNSTTVKDYFNKMPQFASRVKKRQWSSTNPAHKAHLDTIIDKIGRLLDGTSTQAKCEKKKYAIEDLHIKGLERLDAPLARYFQEQVQQKYGLDFFEKPRTAPLNFYTLETPNNSVLESVEVASEEEKEKPISERKYLISCMARNQNYMYWIKDFVTSAQNIGCSVVSFNYSGMDQSKGVIFTKNNMVKDALAQAKRLMELGVQPENIAVEGMSMGGAVATIAAARMHDQGFKVKLYNERSYRSLVRLVTGYLMPKSNSNPWNPINWLRYIAVGLAYVFVAPIMVLSGWHINAASAWDRIPSEYKSYSVARNHQDPKKYDDDEYVHDSYASIASLVDEHRRDVKHKQKKGAKLSREEELLLADKTEEHQFTLERSKANSKFDAHSAPRRFLSDTPNRKKTMQSYMGECLRKTLDIQPAAPHLPPDVCPYIPRARNGHGG